VDAPDAFFMMTWIGRSPAHGRCMQYLQSTHTMFALPSLPPPNDSSSWHM
jgi:hypothetical protein